MVLLKFSSKTAEIKFYVRECLGDGLPHTREEIRAYIKARSANAESFPSTTIESGISDVVTKKGEPYRSVAYGVYQYFPNEDSSTTNTESFSDAIIPILNNTLKQIDEVAKGISVFSLEERDLSIIKQLKSDIEKTIAMIKTHN